MTNPQFSKLTLEITKNLTKEEKKNYGIFITPHSIISSLYSTVIKHLNNNLVSIKRILEPSCGTCEIVNYCDTNISDIEIDGIEYNDKIYNSIKDLKFINKVNLHNKDFIKYNTDKLYDLIIY